MADCYKYKRPNDILGNFNNSLDIIIGMPKYHTDVFWDLGKDISLGSTFKRAASNSMKLGKESMESMMETNRSLITSAVRKESTKSAKSSRTDLST